MDDATDEAFMRRAIVLAEKGERRWGCGSVGCVIVKDGIVIGEGYNQVEKSCDPSAHGEIMAMRHAGQTRQESRFENATLYSTLQPCGMCSMACIWGGISRIVYGAEHDQVHSMYFESRHLQIMDFVHDAFKDDLKLQGGVLGDECAGLYYGPNDHPPEDEEANR